VENGQVSRIHQEDFAQALRLPSDLKYQRNGKAGRWFDVAAIISVLDRTWDREAARLSFVKITIFNLCIGNTDNHAKNHALLYDEGPTPALAPLYDLLPTRLDRRYNHQLAFQIGAASHFDEMTADDLAAFIAAFGVDDMVGFTGQVVVPLIAALEEATSRLRSEGLKQFDDLIGRESEQLVELLSAVVSVRRTRLRSASRDRWLDG
jgi:serine/threonine-protein kinase HipA